MADQLGPGPVVLGRDVRLSSPALQQALADGFHAAGREVIDIGHFLPLAFEDWSHWSGQGSASVRRRVLLIDDAPFFRNMLAPVLKAAGYAVTSAASAQEALILLQAGQGFDVIVTDIEMPGMSGFDLACAVRGDPRLAQLPIIGLSSLVSAESIESRPA